MEMCGWLRKTAPPPPHPLVPTCCVLGAARHGSVTTRGVSAHGVRYHHCLRDGCLHTVLTTRDKSDRACRQAGACTRVCACVRPNRKHPHAVQSTDVRPRPWQHPVRQSVQTSRCSTRVLISTHTCTWTRVCLHKSEAHGMWELSGHWRGLLRYTHGVAECVCVITMYLCDYKVLGTRQIHDYHGPQGMIFLCVPLCTGGRRG